MSLDKDLKVKRMDEVSVKTTLSSKIPKSVWAQVKEQSVLKVVKQDKISRLLSSWVTTIGVSFIMLLAMFLSLIVCVIGVISFLEHNYPPLIGVFVGGVFSVCFLFVLMDYYASDIYYVISQSAITGIRRNIFGRAFVGKPILIEKLKKIYVTKENFRGNSTIYFFYAEDLSCYNKFFWRILDQPFYFYVGQTYEPCDCGCIAYINEMKEVVDLLVAQNPNIAVFDRENLDGI